MANGHLGSLSPKWMDAVWKSLLGLASLAVIGLAGFILTTKDDTAAGLREITKLTGSIERIEYKMDVTNAQVKDDVAKLEERVTELQRELDVAKASLRTELEKHREIEGHLVMRKEFEAAERELERIWKSIKDIESRLDRLNGKDG